MSISRRVAVRVICGRLRKNELLIAHCENLVWGARTLSSNASWKYVNVRRLFICVEQGIRRSMGWAAFEPNDASLWSRVNGMVQAFLTGLWRNGALAGSSAEEAFL